MVQSYTQEIMLPAAHHIRDHIMDDAKEIAEKAGPLAIKLPQAIRRSVQLNKVPNDLKPDLIRLADAIQPFAEKVQANADKLPGAAEKIRDQIVPTAEKAAKVHTLSLAACFCIAFSLCGCVWQGIDPFPSQIGLPSGTTIASVRCSIQTYDSSPIIMINA